MEAAACLQGANESLNLTRTQIALGNVHRLTRDFETARQYLTRAYSGASELQVPREECLALEFLGDVYRDEGKPAEARRYYRRGLAIAEVIAPDGDLVLEIHRREGECLVLEGRAGEGLEVLARALTRSRKLGDRFEEGVVLRCLASGMAATGDLERALQYAESAIEILEDIAARHEHAIARIVAAEILVRQSEQPGTGRPRDLLDRAWDTTVVAQQLTRSLGVGFWSRTVQQLQSRITRRRAEEARYEGERDRRRRAAGDREALPSGLQAGGMAGPREVIIAESRAMKDVLQAVEAFAPEDEPLLLTGETGTGKEVIARRVHALSSRSERPFVAVNVTAIPATMFEREFFGHAKGAFSGAEEDRRGLAAAADGGTLFLDEIGDLPSEVQTKLLRLLQDGSYHALGDPDQRRANLRIIAATNADLEQAVADGDFREDLYYRLAILAIPLPPLRHRSADVIPLFDHFLSEAAGRKVTSDRYFNHVSRRLLEKYHWPGNVRELTVIARRAHIALMRHGRVELEVGTGASAMVITGPEQAAAAASGSGDDLSAPTPSLSRAHILLALEEAGGNRSEAARMLGVSRTTLYRRLSRLGLDPSRLDRRTDEDDT